MNASKLPRIAAVLVAGLLLAAAPALAGPTPDAAPDGPAGPGQVAGPVEGQIEHFLADWWARITTPLVNLFGANGAGVDPNGEPPAESATGDPTADLDHGPGVDPDG